MTLVLVPCLYTLLEERGSKREISTAPAHL